MKHHPVSKSSPKIERHLLAHAPEREHPFIPKLPVKKPRQRHRKCAIRSWGVADVAVTGEHRDALPFSSHPSVVRLRRAAPLASLFIPREPPPLSSSRGHVAERMLALPSRSLVVPARASDHVTSVSANGARHSEVLIASRVSRDDNFPISCSVLNIAFLNAPTLVQSIF